MNEEPVLSQSGEPEASEPETLVQQQEEQASEAQAGASLDLEAELNKAQAQAAEYLDGWQRARAELANYKKRIDRERAEWETVIRGEVISGLLPALDDFDLALEKLPADLANNEWVTGITLVYRKLQTQLGALGLSEIEAVGKPFDPAVHEAVTHEACEGHESGTVIGVIRKGYQLNGKVIRPALVRVAQ